MTDRDTKTRLGRILYAIGSVWIALYFAARFFDVGGTPLGDFLAFFGSSFFIPVVLLFVGRTMQKRGRRVSTEEPVEPQHAHTESPLPHTDRPMPTARPAPPRSEPRQPVSDPEPVDMDELAEAIGFDISGEDQIMPAIDDVDTRPPTSDEMIADAHRLYEEDDS